MIERVELDRCDPAKNVPKICNDPLLSISTKKSVYSGDIASPVFDVDGPQ
jgi:hypothetical protein